MLFLVVSDLRKVAVPVCWSVSRPDARDSSNLCLIRVEKSRHAASHDVHSVGPGPIDNFC